MNYRGSENRDSHRRVRKKVRDVYTSVRPGHKMKLGHVVGVPGSVAVLVHKFEDPLHPVGSA